MQLNTMGDCTTIQIDYNSTSAKPDDSENENMNPLVAGLLNGFNVNHNYITALISDLDEAQMVAQPVQELSAPMNHAAWVASHLMTYRPIIAALAAGKTFDDPLDHPFGMKSSPQADRSVYATKSALLAELTTGRDAVVAAVSSAADSVWAAPVTLERWQSRWTSTGMAVSFLMLNHENMHLGQLSAWRRAMGLPAVKFM